MRLTRAKRSTVGIRKKKEEEPLLEASFAIRDEFITLAQLLKMAGVIGTGGEAKYYLASTPVLVNGEPEQRRGRKLRPGDLVAAPGESPIRITTQDTSDSGGPSYGAMPAPESE